MKFYAYETVFAPDGRLCGSADCLPLDEGALLVVWEKERGTSWTIMGAVRDAKGKWTEAQPVVPADRILRRYPQLYRRADGAIVLLCRVGSDPAEMHTERLVSLDCGLTFGEPVDVMTEGDSMVGGPSRAAVLTLSDGTLRCGGMTPEGDCAAYVYRSQDGGEHWNRSDAIELPEHYRNGFDGGLWSPVLWSEGGTYVHAIMRSSVGYLFRADSYDGGLTWNTPYPLNVANPNSPICGLWMSDLRVFLLCNPNGLPEGKSKGRRTPLALYMSENNGCTFRRVNCLATGIGEFTYPAMKYADNKLYITFTKNKTEVMLAIVESK